MNSNERQRLIRDAIGFEAEIWDRTDPLSRARNAAILYLWSLRAALDVFRGRQGVPDDLHVADDLPPAWQRALVDDLRERVRRSPPTSDAASWVAFPGAAAAAVLDAMTPAVERAVRGCGDAFLGSWVVRRGAATAHGYVRDLAREQGVLLDELDDDTISRLSDEQIDLMRTRGAIPDWLAQRSGPTTDDEFRVLIEGVEDEYERASKAQFARPEPTGATDRSRIEILGPNKVRVHGPDGTHADVVGSVRCARFLAVVRACPKPVSWEDIRKAEMKTAGQEAERRNRRGSERTPRLATKLESYQRDGRKIGVALGALPRGWWSTDRHGATWAGPRLAE